MTYWTALSLWSSLMASGASTREPPETNYVVASTAEQSASKEKCSFPAAPANAKVMLVGAYEGQTISSAVIGGQDEETNLTEIVIDPGLEPLYVILTSYESMIWRFSGDKRRVVRVVVSSSTGAQKPVVENRKTPSPISHSGLPDWSSDYNYDTIPFSGVMGIHRSRTTILYTNCIGYFHKIDSGQFDRVWSRITSAMGRNPDLVIAEYSSSKIMLPSGHVSRITDKTAPPPNGFDPVMWREATRFWPGGLTRVDPRNVVAAAPVAKQKVAPSQMGLSQLIGTGAISRVANGRFRVNRAIPHLPPSMSGAHSAVLIFAKGIPIPPGNPGHGCIIREGDLQKGGALCLKRQTRP